MMQLSEHGAGSKSSILKAAGDLLRETHRELREEAGEDPGHLWLISIGPTGERELIGEFGREGTCGTLPPEGSKELALALHDEGGRTIEVGVLRVSGLDPSLYIQDIRVASGAEAAEAGVPAHGRRFGRLMLLLHLYREVCLSEKISRVRAQLRAESNPHNIRRFEELREILDRYTGKIVETLGRRDFLCYLRRSYLPYDTGSRRWRKRSVGYSIYLPPVAFAVASQEQWQRSLDAWGEALGRQEEHELSPELGGGDLDCHFSLLVDETIDQESGGQEGVKTGRFYGVLACFSHAPYGYLESEKILLASFAEDLALLVRDSIIQHHMALHDQLLLDLNLIDTSDEVLKMATEWLLDLYFPTEIAVLRLEGNYLSLVHTHGIDYLKVPPLNILSEPGGALRAARERKIDYITNTQGDPDYLLVNPETRSQIAVPLYTGETLMGVLLLGFPVVDAIGPADRLLILACSFRIAAILWRTEKARLGSFVAHKLKEILPLLRDNLELLARKDQDDVKAERALNRCIDLVKYWEPRITSLTYAIYEDIVRAEHFDLRELLDKLVAVSSLRAEGRVTVELIAPNKTSYPVRAREQAVEMAFDALISNAIEAMSQDGGKVRLYVSEATGGRGVRNERRFVVIRIEDEGPGVPKEIHHKVFEPLFTTKSGSSTGLGLFIARGVFEGAGGSLRLISPAEGNSEKKGAVFEVRLPINALEI